MRRTRDEVREPGSPGPLTLRPEPWEGDTRGDYRTGLASVDATLSALAEEVAERVGPTTERLLGGDHRLDHVAGWYDELDRRCERLEDDCFVLVALEAPVSADLREIFAVVRSVHEVRRAGKLLRHITETLQELGSGPGVPEVVATALLVLAEGAGALFSAGVAAWRQRDGLAVNELEERDDEVDRLQEGIVAELHRIDRDPEIVAAVALVARWYERIADHGVEISRHASWAVTGDRAAATDRRPRR